MTLQEYVENLNLFLKDYPEWADKTVYYYIDSMNSSINPVDSFPSHLFIEREREESLYIDDTGYVEYLDEALDMWGKEGFVNAVAIN